MTQQILVPHVSQPVSCVSAIRDFTVLAQTVLDVTEAGPDLRGVLIRQLRRDLHVLGVTSEELDAGGLRS